MKLTYDSRLSPPPTHTHHVTQVLKMLYIKTVLMTGTGLGTRKKCLALPSIKSLRSSPSLSNRLELSLLKKGSTTELGNYASCLTKLHDPGEKFAKGMEDNSSTLRVLFTRHCELKAASRLLNYASKYGHPIPLLQSVLTGQEVTNRIVKGLKHDKRYRVVGGAREGG